MAATTLDEFKAQCVARLAQYASSKGEDTAAGHYFDDVSLLLKLLNVQSIRSDNQLFKLVKKL
jgi:hypothetical protein